MNLLVTILAQTEPTYWLPEAVSNFAGPVDRDFYFVYWVSIFFLVLISALLVIFMWKFRTPPGAHAQSQRDHHLLLEITWTGIPIILSFMMFWYGYRGYVDMMTPPNDGISIVAEAQKWAWNFSYASNGATIPGMSEDLNLIRDQVRSGELSAEQAVAAEGKILEKAGLHVPMGIPINITLMAADVLHALYIPAFRVKKDCVPGRTGKIWFIADEPGIYDLYCAEYCGQGHSWMHSKVVVHETVEEYEKWLEVAGSYDESLPFEENGEIVWKRRGCISCHSVDGSEKVGPSWKGLFGSNRSFTATGTPGELVANEAYIEESIRFPMNKITEGYPPQMPVVKLTEKEILWVTEYIKSLGQNSGGAENPRKEN
ncbi:MAG: cytochrome c oxidase subunit II [Planctomycetota bacterium]|nr:cytochrome c oxidase subunit II [Planctomycetota bacterium]